MFYFQTPIYQLFHGSKVVYKLYPLSIIIFFAVVTYIKLASPFTATTPQKFLIRHTSRYYFTNGILEYNDSGYVIFPQDRRIYESSESVENFSMLTNLATTCVHRHHQEEEFCNMPIFHPKEFTMGIHLLEGAVVRGLKPKLKIHLENRTLIYSKREKVKYYRFVIEGPNVILVNILPLWNVKLKEWNFSPNISKIIATDKFEKPYLIHFSYAGIQMNHTLELNFTVSLNDKTMSSLLTHQRAHIYCFMLGQ